MTIPDFQTIMLPLLQFAADGREHALRDAHIYLADYFDLSDSEREQLIPSGYQTIFYNRVSWAKIYMQQAGLLISPRRAIFQISERGSHVASQRTERITVKFLETFPEFVEARSGKKDTNPVAIIPTPIESDSTPEEALERAYQTIRERLVTELLSSIKNVSPQFFEQLVVDLLVKMGYGGSHRDAGKAIGKTGDEGIDGVINEDRLGLDVIYIQAKKWEGSVGRPEIQKFVGALYGRHAKKGVFITTANFAQHALEYVQKIEPKVILIDGKQLAELMIDYGLGVTTTVMYEIKRVDSDYFDQ